MTGMLEPQEALADWEDDVRAFERQDAVSPPPPGALVFTGSSSIRLWTTLERDMAPLAVVNRGFGGARVDDVLRVAARIVFRIRARGVVLYVGENDLEAQHLSTPERVMDGVRQFAGQLADALPDARLYLISVKPSPARQPLWPVMARFNELLRAFACEEPGMRRWVDVASRSFDANGQRRRELFVEDGLHLSPAGYALWTSILRPLLLCDWPAAVRTSAAIAPSLSRRREDEL